MVNVVLRPRGHSATRDGTKLERWTAVTIVRVGTTKKYSDGWDSAFAKGKKKAAAVTAAKPAKKAAKKSPKKAVAAKATPKAAAKKKPAKKK
jgi:hypothetical protein